MSIEKDNIDQIVEGVKNAGGPRAYADNLKGEVRKLSDALRVKIEKPLRELEFVIEWPDYGMIARAVYSNGQDNVTYSETTARMNEALKVLNKLGITALSHETSNHEARGAIPATRSIQILIALDQA